MTRKKVEKEKKKCRTCEKSFTANKNWQKFCSASCRDKYHMGRKQEANKLLAGEQYKRIGKEEDDEDMKAMWNDFCEFIQTHRDTLLKLTPEE